MRLLLVSRHLPGVRRRAGRWNLRPTIWTIGCDDRTSDEVERILALHGISTIVDVRPDRHCPDAPELDGTDIESFAHEAGFGYRRMAHVPDTVTAPEVDAAAESLAALASVTGAVILCREPHPGSCCRSTVLSPALRARGVTVLHILPDGSVRPHESPLPFDR